MGWLVGWFFMAQGPERTCCARRVKLLVMGKIKIGSHQDRELSLNVDVPISTVNRTATRTMVFSKKDSTSFTQPLEDASLLIIQPSVSGLVGFLWHKVHKGHTAPDEID